MDPCPAESTKRSRSNHFGSLGLCFKYRSHNVYAIAAAPIGIPGWPELAFCTASAESMRIVFMHKSSSVCVSVVGKFIFLSLRRQHPRSLLDPRFTRLWIECFLTLLLHPRILFPVMEGPHSIIQAITNGATRAADCASEKPACSRRAAALFPVCLDSEPPRV